MPSAGATPLGGEWHGYANSAAAADDSGHSIATLLEWKTFAEAAAHVEVRGFSVRRGRDFWGLERKMPELVAEMKAYLAGYPFTREFIALSKSDVYNGGDTAFFTYFSHDHPELLGKLKICENYGEVRGVTWNNTKRYHFAENSVNYLSPV